MRVAINCRSLLPGRLEGIGHFTHELVNRWIDHHSDIHFILLFDRKVDTESWERKNVTIEEIYPSARHPVLYKIWFDYRLPGFLRKHKADIFYSPESHCSLRWKGTTIITIHDLAYLHFPETITAVERKYREKYVPKFISHASHIITVSDFSRQDILTRFPAIDAPVSVVPNGCRDHFQPMSPEEISAFRETHTHNKPYFFYFGSLNARKNIANLLRAFALFKKETNAPHLLVLAGKEGWRSKEMKQVYRSHPNQEDVWFTGYLSEEELTNWLGAATALTYVSYFEGFGLPVLEAMRSKVPVITSVKTSMEEIAKEFAFYATPEYPASIANRMKLIYEHPEEADKRTEDAYQLSMQYDWDYTASLLMKIIRQNAK